MANVVLSFHEILLHQADVDLLNGPHWLNDTIISFYFEYLSKIVFSKSSNLLFVPPEVTQCIKMVPPEEISTFLGPLGFENKKFIYFALNDNDSPDTAGGSHWSLLVYSKPESCFLHLDSSMGANHNVAWDFASHVLTFFRRGGSVNFVSKDCAQQTNGYDCGVYLICNAEKLAMHSEQHGEISSCDMELHIEPTVKRREIIDIIESLAHS